MAANPAAIIGLVGQGLRSLLRISRTPDALRARADRLRAKAVRLRGKAHVVGHKRAMRLAARACGLEDRADKLVAEARSRES